MLPNRSFVVTIGKSFDFFCKNQIFNTLKRKRDVEKHPLVIRLGFEPKTHSLEGCCSIQLSYRTPICNLDDGIAI